MIYLFNIGIRQIIPIRPCLWGFWVLTITKITSIENENHRRSLLSFEAVPDWNRIEIGLLFFRIRFKIMGLRQNK